MLFWRIDPLKLIHIRRLAGILAIFLVAATVILGLFVTPPDKVQGNLARLVYVHPPVAWVAYLAYGVTSLASILYLWKPTRSMRWDRIAASSAEVGVVFTALTLLTGSIWGRPAWGVWWTWDARLTTTAILLVLYMGYLALRRIPISVDQRAKRSAIAALIAFVDVPIVHESVDWWRTLHQGATVGSLGMNAKIHGIMAWTLLIGFIAFTLAYVWMVIVRYQLCLADDEILQVRISEWEMERELQGASVSEVIADLLDDDKSVHSATIVNKVR